MTYERPGFPRHLLNKSFSDWTPSERESVRLHFLGPLLLKPQFAKLDLLDAVAEARSLTAFSAEEKQLYQIIFGVSCEIDRCTTVSERRMVHA
jgi:hypothetical protein